MTNFYEQEKDTIDVLVLGSSHAYSDINPSVLWSEYGIASYDLGGSVQPMWNTYYYLVEALKTQRPRLIILEAFCLNYMYDYSDDSRIIKNTYGLKWSSNRLDCLRASAPSKDYWLPLLHEHNRYAAISEEDFRSNLGNPLYIDWKGFINMTSTESFEQPDISNVSSCGTLYKKPKGTTAILLNWPKNPIFPLQLWLVLMQV